MKYKIAIIGSKESIIGFKAAGLATFFSTDTKENIELLYTLRKKTTDQESKEKYAIIFITEDLAQKIPADDYKKLTSEPLPAIISIPSHKGSTGFGLNRLNKIVERAVGSNILG